MSERARNIIYLSKEQYSELIMNNEITVNGNVITYSESDIYVTPQAEPVTDVRINGTSVAANGVANVPIAKNALGTVQIDTTNSYNGIEIDNNGVLKLVPADSGYYKNGSYARVPVTIQRQHYATFYGLAKAAGHDEKNSSESPGTYTPEAKGAIQKMLGVSDLIAPEENNLIASKAYAIGDVFTANGKLYKATAAIAADAAIITDGANANCEETSVGEGFVKFTDYPSGNQPGIVQVDGNLGIGLNYGKTLAINSAPSAHIKSATGTFRPIVPVTQHESTFYGLAKAAGDTTQSVSDNAVGTYTDEAKSAIRTMLGAVGSEDYATEQTAGIVKVNGNYGIVQNGGAGGPLQINYATVAQCRSRTGSTAYQPLTVFTEHSAAFYGLAYAAGDTTMSSSSNAIGTYTDNAKASIKAMLGIQDGSTGTVDVTGTTPTITAVENTRYVCSEVTSLSFTPPASGISIVRFTSGSTVTVLTIPSTVKFPEWFDPTSLETNTIYEICVTDGEFGAVMSWAL